MKLLIDKISSEIGTILIVSDGKSLCALDFEDYQPRMLKLLQKRYGSCDFQEVENPQGFSSLIQAYLQGDRHSLKNLPIETGGTPFQQQVWLALQTIPWGTTISYGELAAKINKPTAYRAVGLANSFNPIAIVLPCHRVIGANNLLTGYAGGLERKRWLLHHEGVVESIQNSLIPYGFA
ncbi:methylated-DNA--[protein]-cysteine S-methyltransferase [Anabaena sp. FACHB-709]|uniref:Methylated-DNA--protein-cysteine methyltransferase n=2 Tax=Nostocaceae TaxID=1162 RepID=A0A1Z4KNP2_ANAVA|nr:MULTISPECIES: methylated-DNA--[protein]-cysteine S-methyltransferase [Nostocaceae]BAY70596.1 O-6-alkylguanine-DNA/cysteine-protein methyltransferase [Trichormus variabilis NIES-23]HBW32732.1 methylated-DNA--[protein]-cysteine S-methyltransferase [Nostoc sp. UBA8866]MBD2172561.1 methylated-DNA--[protein]-cysteine S-methyltransferase [Anabaena cylindrica FACHB-318]MBD2264467.1 methylated-DNA--[protein]-cysteine S-methyltransferase [Anabaena sp. FACHB-709]MBD2274238.1 methylated-DNA--[protein]